MMLVMILEVFLVLLGFHRLDFKGFNIDVDNPTSTQATANRTERETHQTNSLKQKELSIPYLESMQHQK